MKRLILMLSFNKETFDEVVASCDFTEIEKRYTDPATVYALDTVYGRRLNGYMMKASMLRHLLELQESEKNDYPFYFDKKEIARLARFMDIFPDIENLNQKMPFINFQRMILILANCWRDKKDDNLRFNKIILSMGRTNSKSLLASVQLDYDFLIKSHGLSSQDFLAAAIDNSQTRKLYGYIASTLRALYSKAPFAKVAKQKLIRVLATETKNFADNNIIEQKSFNSGTFDSKHYKTAIADEVGELKDNEGLGKIKSGQVQTKDSKILEISTSYKDPTVPFKKEQDETLRAIESGNTELQRTLLLVFAQDDKEEYKDPTTWIKSNPLLDSSKGEMLLKNLIDDRDEKLSLGNLDEFLVKNLNLWLNAKENKFLELKEIEEATVDDKKAKRIKDNARDYYQGIDYSIASDNTAIGYVFPYEENGKQKFHLSQFSFIPWEQQGSIEAKSKRDGINYQAEDVKPYAKVTSHELGLINPDEVFNFLLDDFDNRKSNGQNLAFFGYDSYGLTKVVKAIEANAKFNSFAIKQTASELSPAIDFLRRGFKEGTITIDDDPILKKALVNAEVGSNNYGLYIDKAKASFKIDSVDAIVDAMYQAMYHFDGLGIASKQTAYDKLSDDEFLDYYLNPENGYI